MTYENCLKYAEEAKSAGNEALAEFWAKRAEGKRKLNKLPEPVKEEPKQELLEEEDKPKKRGKK